MDVINSLNGTELSLSGIRVQHKHLKEKAKVGFSW